MNLFTKRLALLSAAVVGTGAIASVATGATFALFSSSATTNLSQTYNAGTVTFAGGVTDDVTLSNIVPGDCSYNGTAPYTWTSLYYSGTPLCGDDLGSTASYTLTYSGSAPAFVGVDLTISATAAATPSGADPLWDPNNSNGGLEVLVGYQGQFSLYDLLDIGNGAWASFAGGDWTCTGSPITCTATIDNIELPVGPSYGSTHYGNVNWVSGDSQTLYVDWVFENGTSDNQFQGDSATVTIHGHAVQAGGGNTTLIANGSSAASGLGHWNVCDSPSGAAWNSTPANPTQSYAYLPTAPSVEFGGSNNYACPGSW